MRVIRLAAAALAISLMSVFAASSAQADQGWSWLDSGQGWSWVADGWSW